MKELPLASLSVLKKLTPSKFDSMKFAKLLREKQTVFSDCVLIIDEIYKNLYNTTVVISWDKMKEEFFSKDL